MVENKVIKVIGIGSGGCNIVNEIMSDELKYIEFWAMNTDKQLLELSKAPHKIQLGPNTTNGLCSGGNILTGKKSAEESKDDIESALKGADLVFLISCLGGGTGSGATKVVANIAKKLGITTVCILTSPFSFESRKRTEKANDALAEIQETSDSIILFNNDGILKLITSCDRASLKEAFSLVNKKIFKLIKIIYDITFDTALIDISPNDLQKIFHSSKTITFLNSSTKGANRATKAAKQAINEVSFGETKHLLINISASSDINLNEAFDAMSVIAKQIPDNVQIVFGCSVDKNKTDEIEVSIIAGN